MGGEIDHDAFIRVRIPWGRVAFICVCLIVGVVTVCKYFFVVGNFGRRLAVDEGSGEAESRMDENSTCTFCCAVGAMLLHPLYCLCLVMLSRCISDFPVCLLIFNSSGFFSVFPLPHCLCDALFES